MVNILQETLFFFFFFDIFVLLQGGLVEPNVYMTPEISGILDL